MYNLGWGEPVGGDKASQVLPFGIRSGQHTLSLSLVTTYCVNTPTHVVVIRTSARGRRTEALPDVATKSPRVCRAGQDGIARGTDRRSRPRQHAPVHRRRRRQPGTRPLLRLGPLRPLLVARHSAQHCTWDWQRRAVRGHVKLHAGSPHWPALLSLRGAPVSPRCEAWGRMEACEPTPRSVSSRHSTRRHALQQALQDAPVGALLVVAPLQRHSSATLTLTTATLTLTTVPSSFPRP